MQHLQHVASDDTADGTATAIPDRARALALDILHRIRPLCAHMPDGELLELSTRMALVELRYFEEAATEPPARRRVSNG
jgi:hypothetical protein